MASLYVEMPGQRRPWSDVATLPAIQPRNQTPEQPNGHMSPSSTESAVTTSRSEDSDDGVAPTQMDNDASGMGTRSAVVESGSKALAVPPRRLDDILSRYERFLGERASGYAKRLAVAQNEDARSPSPDRHIQQPVQHETAPDAALPRDRSQEMPLRRGHRRREVTGSGVQKKRASTRSGQEYKILRLGGVRHHEGKQMEFKVIWAPFWLTLEDLRGQQTFEEAKKLAVDKFGRDAWEKESYASGLLEALDMDSEVEYASA